MAYRDTMTDTNMTIEEFLLELFGAEEGFVYAPTKYIHNQYANGFMKHWFKWPEHKQNLINLFGQTKDVGDQYLSPVLYDSPDTRDFKISRVVWCDFDEGIPNELGDFPKASIEVSSSSRSAKAHWYWRTAKPITDSTVVERYNRQLAYALGADKGCWNFGRVLRPIGTLNHKYDPPAPVSLAGTSDTKLDDYIFAALPDVPETTREEFDYRTTPIQELTKKYSWSPKAWDFFTSPKYDGERHNALTSVAITCFEMGMTRDEVMSYLLDADSRWKKYVGRSDRRTRLQSICLYAESVVSKDTGITGESSQGLSGVEGSGKGNDGSFEAPRRFSAFVKHQYQVDWVIEDLIHQQGLAIVAAPPGIGKTQFSLNLALSVASGKDFLNWKVSKPRKVLFLSLEMMQPELKFYLDKMASEFTEEERESFDANCFFVARQAFRLNSETNQRIFLDWIDELQPEGIFIDSLSRCTGGDLEKGEIDAVFDFLNKEVRDKRKCFIWFVHHNRKANFNQKQPKKLEDLYGSQYIGAYASTVVGLWKITNQEIEVNCLKVWLSKPFKSFLMERTPNLTFKTGKMIEV